MMILCKYLKPAPASLILVLLCFAMSGCGSNTRVPVEGSVTLEGQPVDGGTITFAPEEYIENGTTRTVVTADIKGGKYSLDASHGAEPGKYRVEIYWKKKTGRHVPSEEPPGTKEEVLNYIPRPYNEGSRTVVEIKSGGNKFDYALKSSWRDENRPGSRRNPLKD